MSTITIIVIAWLLCGLVGILLLYLTDYLKNGFVEIDLPGDMFWFPMIVIFGGIVSLPAGVYFLGKFLIEKMPSKIVIGNKEK